MKKVAGPGIIGLLICLLLGFYSVKAQAFREPERPSLKANGSFIEGEPKRGNGNNVEMTLRWSVDQKSFWLKTHANVTTGVYFIKRKTPKGYEGFGRGRQLTDSLASKGYPITFKGTVDSEKPYLLRYIGKGFLVEATDETTEIQKLFLVLDDLIAKKGVPYLERQTLQDSQFSDLEIFDAIMFRTRKHWRWKETK